MKTKMTAKMGGTMFITIWYIGIVVGLVGRQGWRLSMLRMLLEIKVPRRHMMWLRMARSDTVITQLVLWSNLHVVYV